MSEFEIDLNDLGTPGVIADIKGYMLPPEAWTYGHNVRAMDGAMVNIAGQTQVFGTPTIAPHFMLPIKNSSSTYWLYTSLLKAYVYDGASHTDITRAVGGDYTAGATRDWNGTIIGGVPILNNGNDVPQYWASYNPATKLQPLTNWPSGYKARVIRAFDQQLVAFGLTKSGVAYDHSYLFSSAADPGALPSSWDVTDPTQDTGENAFPDAESGLIVDAQMLRGAMYVGKENAIWRLLRIGGRFIFDSKSYLETFGLLAPRCMTNVGRLGQQTMWGQDDILIHNGASQESILDKKWRRTMFSRIDGDNYKNCFSFDNTRKSEIWFCYPTAGQVNPNEALIWNYKDGSLTTTDVNFRNVAAGFVSNTDLAWDDETSQTWDGGDDNVWDVGSSRRLVIAQTDTTKFSGLDEGITRNGTPISSILQRTGLALLGRKRDGSWIVDHRVRKLYNRVWPKIVGGPVYIRMGVQELVDGPVTWGPTQLFNPATDVFVDVGLQSGRALCIEISSTDAVSWRLDGYKVEYSKLGEF